MLPVAIKRGLGAAGLAAIALAAGATAQALAKRRTLKTVQYVDLDRYLGTWFEIARLPARFERDCVGATATYSRLPDGHLQVTNRCHRGSCQGKLTEAVGSARVVDTVSNAKLKVYFFGPFGGDYWIIDLGPDYDYALVGAPSRKYLWILSRTPTMEPALFQRLVDEARDQGFEVDRLIRTEACVVQ